MNIKRNLSIVVAASLVSTASYGAAVVPDGRGNGMGNAGVTSADYVLAPFYNPALVAVYRDSDSFGVLFPAIGIRVRDTDESLATIDDLQDTIKAFENGGSGDQTTVDQLNSYLTRLADDKPLAVNGGVGVSVALPIDTISSNFFARGYAEVIASTKIAADGGNSASAVQSRYENSSVDVIAFGLEEYGVALAKIFVLSGQQVSIGVTPKLQQMRTYNQNLSVEDFDIDDYDQTEKKKNAFNIDLGAVWVADQFRAGIAIKDLFSQRIDTLAVNNTMYRYELDTQVTVSGSYTSTYFTATADLDLTEQGRFVNVNDDTQFLRFGIEGNAAGWAQLRAGYEIDIEDTLDNSVTAGIGISPGDLVSFDVAGSYAGDNQFGVSANLAFTF
ncbi:conjugal transfer protein TraF [Vibrio sonorensis]|uniref:conjugal transfer protein TraF n=1 Tax=Vibrio sonorensis TaxID=1004316 RepID=UPI0008DA2D11|nr:conjugal transfer protein TraF [Vibrio sonorensis]